MRILYCNDNMSKRNCTYISKQITKTLPQLIARCPLLSPLNGCSQIEYLQETNRSLEQKVQGLQQRKADASAEAADLSMRNQELCQELTHIDHLAQQLEKDKELVLETADEELQEAKVMLLPVSPVTVGQGVQCSRTRSFIFLRAELRFLGITPNFQHLPDYLKFYYLLSI